MAIPERAPRQPSALELPFKDLFGHMTPGSTSFFVPASFWTAPREEGGRGVPTERAERAGYARDKIKGAFRLWREKHPEAAEGLDVVIVRREPGDAEGRFTEAGLSVHLVRAASGATTGER